MIALIAPVFTARCESADTLASAGACVGGDCAASIIWAPARIVVAKSVAVVAVVISPNLRMETPIVAVGRTGTAATGANPIADCGKARLRGQFVGHSWRVEEDRRALAPKSAAEPTGPSPAPCRSGNADDDTSDCRLVLASKLANHPAMSEHRTHSEDAAAITARVTKAAADLNAALCAAAEAEIPVSVMVCRQPLHPGAAGPEVHLVEVSHHLHQEGRRPEDLHSANDD
ncbi:hypothetical protein LQ948_08810 [Jiella sp. MQZ9-1]|uniref:Uncharacterized protein n=1 Tax=Jiella flava TaxID=2816857 RepID=A0A939JX27_9HYPH|nr:hypothetical protein [Jiella flava]MBO0662931.1 hypothetical protein [Jiella flava]MCD2471309.1 hypothetical protein [Jiella flava]